MTPFTFINHEKFPEDPYILEAVVLCLDGKHRITYIRKKMKNGGMYWDVISASVQHHGEKKYLKSYSQDSNFLHDDIMAFLNKRVWEKNKSESKSEEAPF